MACREAWAWAVPGWQRWTCHGNFMCHLVPRCWLHTLLSEPVGMFWDAIDRQKGRLSKGPSYPSWWMPQKNRRLSRRKLMIHVSVSELGHSSSPDSTLEFRLEITLWLLPNVGPSYTLLSTCANCPCVSIYVCMCLSIYLQLPTIYHLPIYQSSNQSIIIHLFSDGFCSWMTPYYPREWAQCSPP